MEMLDGNEYNKLLQKAKEALKNHPHLEPSDIVADVILEFMEAGKFLYLHDLVKAVRNKAISSGHNDISTYKSGELRNSKIYKSEQVRVCSCCHESKPVAEFYIVYRKVKGSTDANSTMKEMLYYCIPCQKAKSAEQAKKYHTDTNLKLSAQKANRKYQKKIREKRKINNAAREAYNAKMREYYKTPQWKEYLRKRNEAKKQALL